MLRQPKCEGNIQKRGYVYTKSCCTAETDTITTIKTKKKKKRERERKKKSWWLGFSPMPGGPGSPLKPKGSPTLPHVCDSIPSRARGDSEITTVPQGPGSPNSDRHLKAEQWPGVPGPRPGRFLDPKGSSSHPSHSPEQSRRQPYRGARQKPRGPSLSGPRWPGPHRQSLLLRPPGPSVPSPCAEAPVRGFPTVTNPAG